MFKRNNNCLRKKISDVIDTKHHLKTTILNNNIVNQKNITNNSKQKLKQEEEGPVDRILGVLKELKIRKGGWGQPTKTINEKDISTFINSSYYSRNDPNIKRLRRKGILPDWEINLKYPKKNITKKSNTFDFYNKESVKQGDLKNKPILNTFYLNSKTNKKKKSLIGNASYKKKLISQLLIKINNNNYILIKNNPKHLSNSNKLFSILERKNLFFFEFRLAGILDNKYLSKLSIFFLSESVNYREFYYLSLVWYLDKYPFLSYCSVKRTNHFIKLSNKVSFLLNDLKIIFQNTVQTLNNFVYKKNNIIDDIIIKLHNKKNILFFNTNQFNFIKIIISNLEPSIKFNFFVSNSIVNLSTNKKIQIKSRLSGSFFHIMNTYIKADNLKLVSQFKILDVNLNELISNYYIMKTSEIKLNNSNAIKIELQENTSLLKNSISFIKNKDYFKLNNSFINKLLKIFNICHKHNNLLDLLPRYFLNQLRYILNDIFIINKYNDLFLNIKNYKKNIKIPFNRSDYTNYKFNWLNQQRIFLKNTTKLSKKEIFFLDQSNFCLKHIIFKKLFKKTFRNIFKRVSLITWLRSTNIIKKRNNILRRLPSLIFALKKYRSIKINKFGSLISRKVGKRPNMFFLHKLNTSNITSFQSLDLFHFFLKQKWNKSKHKKHINKNTFSLKQFNKLRLLNSYKYKNIKLISDIRTFRSVGRLLFTIIKKKYFRKRRNRRRNFFLKLKKQNNFIKPTLLTRLVNRTSKYIFYLNNNKTYSYLYITSIEQNKLLNFFRNFLITNGKKTKATNIFIELLQFIKNSYKVCPNKILRFLILKHYQIGLIKEKQLKKKVILIPKRLSIKKQIFYMVFSFFKEVKSFNKIYNASFSYRLTNNKKKKIIFSIENYISHLMSLGINFETLVKKNQSLEQRIYSLKHFIKKGRKSSNFKKKKKYSNYKGHIHIPISYNSL